MLRVWSWGSKLSKCGSAKGTAVILCSARSPAVPKRVLVAPCKFGLIFITARDSCACATVPRSFWNAFVLAHHDLQELFVTRSGASEASVTDLQCDRLQLNNKGVLLLCSIQHTHFCIYRCY